MKDIKSLSKSTYLGNPLKVKDKRYNNLKNLANEMVTIIIDKNKKESEEDDNDDGFYAINLKSLKHKSQIFFNRNKNLMLKYFSLNKTNEENVKTNDFFDIRKSGRLKPINTVNYTAGKPSFILSLKNNTPIISEEKKPEENENKQKLNLEISLDKKEQEENNEFLDFLKYENLLEYEADEFIENNNQEENFEILNVNPVQIDTSEIEELTTDKREKPGNNNIDKNKKINLRDKKAIGKYLYEKGTKMINMKNNKIQKKKEIMNKEIKDMFDIRKYLNKNSIKYMNQKKNYVSIQNKAEQVYRIHLAQIEFNKKSNLIKKKNKEREDIKKYKKDINNKKFSQENWNNFYENENTWLQNNLRNKKELLNENYKKIIYDKPKINKKSIIMLEQKQKEEKNKKELNNINIYTKLYNDKNIYDNKLKIRIQNSTPSFAPKITKCKTQKFLNTLNNVIFSEKKEKNKVKTINNKQKKYNYLTSNSMGNKTPKKINFDHKKTIRKKNISITNDIFNPKIISSKTTTKKLTQNYKNNQKDTYRKTVIYEYNINNSNNDKNIKEQKLTKNNSLSVIKKLTENASKKLLFSKPNENKKSNSYYNIFNKEIKNDNENTNNKEIVISKNQNTNERKNNKHKKINLQIKDYEKLYNLNIRDHTSNTMRQNVILTSKKYIDFFKL